MSARRTCSTCGREFVQLLTGGRPAKYCSTLCKSRSTTKVERRRTDHAVRGERRRQVAGHKADLLDVLHQTLLQWEPPTERVEDIEPWLQAQAELGRQLYEWAVRITPQPGEGSE